MKRRFRYYQLGSNQYKTRERGIPRYWLAVFFLAFLFWLLSIGKVCQLWNHFMGNFRPANLVSPLSLTVNVATAEAAEPLEVKTPEQKEIAEYIREVFGADADKAFKLLSCENASLNPHAVNTAGNFPAGSRDIGVFQINEFWQGVNGKFLFNYKINVLAAYQIYTDNGRSFERWTCGRKLGI